MADTFEGRGDLAPYRERLWPLIEATPSLDWLLLTKRSRNIANMLPAAWLEAPRPNVWLGTTTENQKYADERIPELLKVPAAVHFASCEPLLGPLDLGPYLAGERHLSWVIVGGESGPGARPMHAEWLRSVRDQVIGAGVALHFKQWGQFDEQLVRLRKKGTRVLDGRTWDEFPRLGEPEPDLAPDPVVDLTGIPIDALLAEIRRRASH